MHGFNCQEDRATVLAGLSSVDYIVIFEETEPTNLLSRIKPAIHVKASEYSLDPNAPAHTKMWEKEIVEKNGGEVRLLPLVHGKSTTGMIQRIVDAYKDASEFKERRQRK